MTLENDTRPETPDPGFWGFYGIIVPLFVASTYLMVSITTYIFLKALKDRNMALIRSRSPSTNVSRKKQSLETRVSKHAMIGLCLAISVFSVAQFSIQQPLLFKAHLLGGPVHLAYKYVDGIQIVLGYVFMWFRQRLFYSGSSPLRHVLKNNKVLIHFSTFSIFFAMVNVVVQMALTWYWHKTSNGLYEAITWAVMCFFVQGTLFTLFFYPLLKHKKEQRRYLSNSMSRNESGNPVRNLQRLIRRCVFIAIVYFSTDLIPVLVMIFYMVAHNTHLPILWVFLLQDFNSVINIICLVGTFRNWKNILGPWRKYKRKLERKAETRNTRSTTLSVSAGST
ncbi:uncharacterized protein LOC143459361 [Clavelina lepadiformis]|uniref:uncharacterized protein LOC143459361 n=1 Tax=Clavelina lepadiformis TaxID=159417 RepID=UPI004042D6F2